MSIKIKVRHQGINLEITKEREGRFLVPDYTTGERVRHVRTTEAKARDKAKEICEAMASGQTDILGLSPYESEIRAAFDALPGGIRLGRAVELVRDCCEIVDPNEIVVACRFWKDHRPDKKFTPKRVGDAVNEYLSRQSRLAERLLDYCFARSFGAGISFERQHAAMESLQREIQEKINPIIQVVKGIREYTQTEAEEEEEDEEEDTEQTKVDARNWNHPTSRQLWLGVLAALGLLALLIILGS